MVCKISFTSFRYDAQINGIVRSEYDISHYCIISQLSGGGNKYPVPYDVMPLEWIDAFSIHMYMIKDFMCIGWTNRSALSLVAKALATGLPSHLAGGLVERRAVG